MGKTAFIFPGQGAQYVGMGKDFYNNFKSVRHTFHLADDVLGINLSELCFNGPEEKLKETIITQPAVLTMSMACLSVLRENDIYPDAVAGLSLGEYSALVAAGSLTMEDAVPLVQKRGKLMQEAVPLGEGSMAAIMGLSRDDVKKACKEASVVGVVEPANFNCPGQIVIAGHLNAVKRAIQTAKKLGAKKIVELPVSAPFHTSLLKPVGNKLAYELSKVDIKDVKTPLVANVNADYVFTKEEVKDALIKQVSSPVKWEDSIRRLASQGITTFIEVGPGKALSGFIKKIDRSFKALNVEKLDDLIKLKETLKEDAV
jgi:[acyl-carrier-protein] S-malonyltransferase